MYIFFFSAAYIEAEFIHWPCGTSLQSSATARITQHLLYGKHIPESNKNAFYPSLLYIPSFCNLRFSQ